MFLYILYYLFILYYFIIYNLLLILRGKRGETKRRDTYTHFFVLRFYAPRCISVIYLVLYVELRLSLAYAYAYDIDRIDDIDRICILSRIAISECCEQQLATEFVANVLIVQFNRWARKSLADTASGC